MMMVMMLMMVMLSIMINSILMCRPVHSRRVVAMTWPYQFSSVQNGIHALGNAHTIMRSTPSLRGSPNVAFDSSSVRLTDDGRLSSFQRRSSRASSFHATLLQASMV